MDLCTPALFWGGAIPAGIPWSVMMLPMNLTSLDLTCSLLSFSLMFLLRAALHKGDKATVMVFLCFLEGFSSENECRQQCRVSP